MTRRSHLIGVARNPDLEALRCDGHRAPYAQARLDRSEQKIDTSTILVGQKLIHVYIRHEGPVFRYGGWQNGAALVSDDSKPNQGPMRIHPTILVDRYRIPAPIGPRVGPWLPTVHEAPTGYAGPLIHGSGYVYPAKDAWSVER